MFWSIFFNSLALILVIMLIGWLVSYLIQRRS